MGLSPPRRAPWSRRPRAEASAERATRVPSPLGAPTRERVAAAVEALSQDGSVVLGRLRPDFLGRLPRRAEQKVGYASGREWAERHRRVMQCARELPDRETRRGRACAASDGSPAAGAPGNVSGPTRPVRAGADAVERIFDYARPLAVSPELWDLVLDPTVLAVARAHLGAAPALMQASAWRTWLDGRGHRAAQ